MSSEEKSQRLQTMLEVAVEQDIKLFKGGVPASPQEIVDVQRVHEDMNYIPEFIVKNVKGEIKEILYGKTLIKSGSDWYKF